MAKGQGACGEGWLQELIAGALTMGVGKRELFEDYYFDELGSIIEAWNALHGAEKEMVENAEPFDFLGEGGEWL